LAEINIILNILEELIKVKPDNLFIRSLHQQFCNIGGLSKKQLEGLHAFATKSGIVTTAKLATLEAIIKKKPTRYKSEIIKKAPEIKKDTTIENLIEQIIAQYPQHKMALWLQSKIKGQESLSQNEISEVKRLAKILLNK
jgi:hypothetical protein